MSRANQSQFEFARVVTPAVGSNEPDLWFQELRLLHRLSADQSAEIRRISLNPGLNILWSPSEDAETDAILYREGWGGHAAGKTLFCRILRYLLGEPNFSTEAVVENIQGRFPELWAVARIRVRGEAWIVGRSLVHLGEGFATPGEDLNAILQTGAATGNFEVFRARLEALAGASLEKLYPEEAWRHLLPWLARDQEARYARVTAWRDSLSEADHPTMSVNRQHSMMRAVLSLLNPREHELQTSVDEIDEAIRHTQPDIERKAAVEQREAQLLQTAARLATGKELVLEDIDAAASSLQSHREVREQRLQQLEKEPEPAAIRTVREAYEAAFSELSRVRQEAKEHERRSESLTRQGNELMGTVDRARSAGIIDPKRAAEGWCPHTLEWAQKHGCVDKPAGAETQSSVTIEELEAQANRSLEEAQQAGIERGRCESRLEQLEAALADRSGKYAEAVRDSRRQTSSVQRELTLLEQCESRLAAYKETANDLERERRRYKANLGQVEQHRAEIGKLRDAAKQDLLYFSEIYGDVIKAVVGASVDGGVEIDGNGLHLRATKQGELSGAALETVKTLAFDLAGVVAGMEGKCGHPRFLIHDGPREADMARVIYEKFFLYVVDRLEAAFADKSRVNFQYILTTTTSPPKQMQEGSEWLIAKLSSRTKADRLLCENI